MALDELDNDKVDLRFLVYALRYTGVGKAITGTAQPQITRQSLKSISVALPPLQEQKRIAEILDRAEALRAKRRAALALLDELTQSIFLDMFGGEKSKNSWDREELKSVVRDGTLVTYGIVQAGEEHDGGVPYIRTGDIVNGEIKLDSLRHTAPEIAAKFDRSRVRFNDIVMSIRATVGTTAIVPESLDGANLTQGTAKISPGERVTLAYLLHYLRSGSTQHWIQRQIKGATFREITLTRLRQLPVLIPPMDLQQVFTERITAIEKARGQLRDSAGAMNTLFDSIQQRAFRGEL